MSTVVRNIVAVIAGIIIGGVVNSALIKISPSLIPPPAGADVTTAEGLRAAMQLFEPRHFVMPFLAHALGTLAGALAAYLIAGSHKSRFAFAIGIVFLCGGIAASVMIPAPAWFIAVDLVGAYLPMAWLAIQIGRMMQRSSATPHANIA